MKTRQGSKLSMYSAVINFCYNNMDVITSIPALQEAFNDFEAIYLSLNAASNNKDNVIPGITLDKNQLRDKLERATAYLALNTYAYAHANNNNELKAATNFKLPDLKRMKQKQLPGVCLAIVDVVNENLPALAAYNITAASVKEVTDTLAAYEGYVSRPRIAATAVSYNIDQFSNSIRREDSILKNRMDRIIATLPASHPAFHEMYFSNRMIIDPPTTVTQIKGTVTAKDTGKPLGDVTITINETGTTVTTDAEGNFAVKPMAKGRYTIAASKKGYAPETITGRKVKLGQITKIDIKMVTAGEEIKR